MLPKRCKRRVTKLIAIGSPARPIKRIGDFTVPVRLHRDVSIDLQVKVVPEGEVIVGHMTPEQEAEAAQQVKGETTEEESTGAEE